MTKLKYSRDIRRVIFTERPSFWTSPLAWIRYVLRG